MSEKKYWLGWQLLLPGTGKRIWQIIDYFNGPENAWLAGEKDLLAVPNITPVMAEGLIWQRARINLDDELERLYKHKVEFVCFDDEVYPAPLREIFDPPPGLFVRGDLKKWHECSAAVVGTRKPTAYGITAARRLSAELAENNVVVISGLARGIDTAAHSGCLEADGCTVAVLGCGADVVYPRENAKLFAEIVEKGAVVTEFPLGSPPEAWHFPSRNRIISGLSQVVVVVESAEKSGALITADLALEQGRDVMAVPGSIYSNMSKGPLKLLKQGAKPVTDVSDILDELGIERLFNESKRSNQPKMKLGLTEQTIYQKLSGDPMHLEELISQLKVPSQEVISALMFLEVKGLVKKLPGKMYAVVNSGHCSK